MSKFGGYLQLRRGVWEHVKDGRMSKMDALCFIYIVGQADTRSGVWNGSASALSGELAMSPRTSRDVLERLSARGYLKRFPTPGKHSCYPILVHKFLITDGEHSGEHLNAKDSISKDSLRYFPREQRVEDYGEHGGEHGAAQKRIEKRKERKKEGAPENGPPAAQDKLRPSPFVFTGTHFKVSEKQDHLLAEAFHWVERPLEYAKADSWLEANPSRRPKNANRFLQNWFSRIPAPSNGNGHPPTSNALSPEGQKKVSTYMSSGAM